MGIFMKRLMSRSGGNTGIFIVSRRKMPFRTFPPQKSMNISHVHKNTPQKKDQKKKEEGKERTIAEVCDECIYCAWSVVLCAAGAECALVMLSAIHMSLSMPYGSFRSTESPNQASVTYRIDNLTSTSIAVTSSEFMRDEELTRVTAPLFAFFSGQYPRRYPRACRYRLAHPQADFRNIPFVGNRPAYQTLSEAPD